MLIATLILLTLTGAAIFAAPLRCKAWVALAFVVLFALGGTAAAVGALALIGGLALFAFTKLYGIVFLGAPRTHEVGFLVIENGVFLFSMAVGVEMPSMIEIAIMLDILISILMLGLFLTKIGARFRIGDTDLLTNVKD